MIAERARELGYLLVGLAELAEKYDLLAELAAGEPGRTVERRDAMRKVAARFPAALREFDQTSADERQRRTREIEDVLAALVADFDGGRGLAQLQRADRTWIRPAAELHAYLRELLKVKRWLGRRAPTDEVLSELAAWHAESGDPRWPVEHWTRERLAAIAQPPGGRVTALAYEEIAARHGMDAAQLRRELFGSEDE